jgi:hypothetical protein
MPDDNDIALGETTLFITIIEYNHSSGWHFDSILAVF